MIATDLMTTVTSGQTTQEHDIKAISSFCDQARGNGAEKRTVYVGEIEIVTSLHGEANTVARPICL